MFCFVSWPLAFIEHLLCAKSLRSLAGRMSVASSGDQEQFCPSGVEPSKLRPVCWVTLQALGLRGFLPVEEEEERPYPGPADGPASSPSLHPFPIPPPPACLA